MFFYDNPSEENITTTSPPDQIFSTSYRTDDGVCSTDSNEKDKEEDEYDNLQYLPFTPKLLLMGLPRSGKSSIQNVVFHKMTPNETFFLESTKVITKNDYQNSPMLQFQLWDYPGHNIQNMFESKETENLFLTCDAVIFVMDAQDDNANPLSLFVASMVKSFHINPKLKYHLFIHKIDGLSDEQKIEAQRQIYQVLKQEMDEATLHDIYVKFYMTSIYDYSIYEAISKVVQQLIPQLPALENLLNIFITGSGIEKAFLCDVVSKIYIATDSNPVDIQTYELCCDMIDVLVDLSCIYGLPSMKKSKSTVACPFDAQSQAVIKLSTSVVLYLREINKYLALVCIVRDGAFKKQGLIDYNFQCLKDAIKEIFRATILSTTPSEDSLLADS